MISKSLLLVEKKPHNFFLQNLEKRQKPKKSPSKTRKHVYKIEKIKSYESAQRATRGGGWTHHLMLSQPTKVPLWGSQNLEKVPCTWHVALSRHNLSSNAVPHWFADTSGRLFSRKPETNKVELCGSPDICLANPKPVHILFLSGRRKAFADYFFLFGGRLLAFGESTIVSLFFLQVP